MAAPAQQGNQPEGSMGILWTIAGIFAVAAALWYYFKHVLVSFYFKLKLFEISIVSYFTSQLDDVRAFILAADVKTIPYDNVVRVGDLVGNYVRYPFVIIVVVLGCVVYFANSTRVFKRTYSMHDLAQLEKKNWPQIAPVVNLDLLSVDIDVGPWAMALTPMQFCKKHKLLEEYKRQPQEGVMRKDWDKVEVKLKRGEANKIFSVQLGPLWRGVEHLPPHAKVLFAAFAARSQGDSKASTELLLKVSASSEVKLDFTGVDELCQKYAAHKSVKELVSRHAYVLTVLASLLEFARTDGVQASADFLWLKPVDRRLWYMMNTVGRQTPFVEVSGPFAHWIAERHIGKKIVVPMIEEATNALENSLKDIIYKPDEEQ